VVRQAIAEGGTRDAWELIRQGRLNHYPGSVMAAMLLVEAPALLQD
jgi:hypothetical protein